MSTRGLVLVKKNNEIKIAEYNGHDSYIEGLCHYLYDIIKNKEELFFLKSIVDRCKFVPKISDIDDFKLVISKSEFNDFYDALKSRLNDNNEILLEDSSSFGKDSLFCEWAYMIDFDENKLVIFKGFNTYKEMEDPLFHTEELDKELDNEYCGCRRLYEMNFEDELDFDNLLVKITEKLKKS